MSGEVTMDVSDKLTLLEGSRDVVITVIHNSVNKIRTRPMRVFRDEEKGIEQIARAIHKETNATIIINNTDIDLNSEESATDNKDLLTEFKRIIDKIAPQVVIDLHGMANQGSLFNNSKDTGLKAGREFVEKPIKGVRPDVDIGFRRKSASNFCTSRGETILRVAKFLSYQGLITDIEAVFPGGNFIGKMATMDRDVMAIEVARRIRDSIKKRKTFVRAITNFIDSLRGQAVPDEVNTAFDVEKITKIVEKEEKKEVKKQIKSEETSGYIG